MGWVKFVIAVFALLTQLSCVSDYNAASTMRVLFVGNSITYYHGVPYLFSAISANLYDKSVDVDYLVQPGGHLADVLSHKKTVSELGLANYDVVILQEWGSQLLCAASPAERHTPSCAASLNAHRRLAEIAGSDDSITVLLGTFQLNRGVAKELLAGEDWFVERLGFDKHVNISSLLIEGESQLPSLSWRARDEIHPGPALSLAISLAIANSVYGSAPATLNTLDLFETRESPAKTMSYRSIEKDLSLFHTSHLAPIDPSELESILSLVTELQRSTE